MALNPASVLWAGYPMGMPRLILLDDGLACLGPLDDLRASFEQRSGVFNALERCEHDFGLSAQLHLSEEDAALAHERTTATTTTEEKCRAR